MVFGDGGLLSKLFLPAYADAGADTSFKPSTTKIGDQVPMAPSGSSTTTSTTIATCEDINDTDTCRTSPVEEVTVQQEEEQQSLLQPFGTNIWIVEGPVVDFYGFPYPTRMVCIKLTSGDGWIWSPVELTEELAQQVERTIGPVRYIVTPNALHWLFMKRWQERFPDAKFLATLGLQDRKVVKDVTFHGALDDGIPMDFSDDIDQITFEGGVLDEIVFFHKPSSTVIVCDLIQRLPVDLYHGWKAWIMSFEGLIGPTGSTPKELIFSFWINGLFPKARQSLDKILLEWQPEKLIIAHGENAQEGATYIVEHALQWIPKQPTTTSCTCGCFPISNEQIEE